MTIAEVPAHTSVLPDTPYALWERGELHDLLLLPHDGTRVEIIGGRIAVSPAPSVRHGVVVQDISDAFKEAAFRDPSFDWAPMQVVHLGKIGIGDGYIPDLVILAKGAVDAANDADFKRFVPDEIELAAEVTSEWGAENDHPPTARQEPTKWSGYAGVEIPYYLLVDRSPDVANTTLYSIPDQATGAYLHRETWAFGETIHLPDPFDIEIKTGRWKPWTK